MQKVYQLLEQFFVNLHNFSYKAISKLAIKRSAGLHPKHDILNYHQFFINHVKPTDVVIDVGCGNGANSFDIAQKAKRVIGIDISAENLAYAKQHFQRDNLEFIEGDVTKLDFTKLGVKHFDKIVFSNVLEHIEDRVEFLKSLRNLSDTLLLRVPMLTRGWLAVYKKEQGYEYRLDKTHTIEYTLEILQEELDRSGWQGKDYSIQFGEFWGVFKSKGND